MQKNKLVVPLAALALLISSGTGFVALAHADTVTDTTQTSDTQKGEHQRPAAVGTVTAVDGSTITLTDKQSGTTYTVDASAATLVKHEKPADGQKPAAPTTITVADVAVGDTLMVQGTVSGSTITATRIDDGEMMGGRGMGHRPGVEGTVTAVNGTTVTVTGTDGKTYTVAASGATVSKMQTISVSDIQVGDSVGIEGTVSGTDVTATHLMDGIPAHTQSATVSS